MMVTQRQSQGCFCPKSLDRVAENAKLKEQLERLKSKLARQERTAKEQPFGLSTPSSQKRVKPSLPEMDEAVKHADETRWRTDGDNGYAWLFLAGHVRLFVCAGTRAMSVPEAVLADSGGLLMTDRYSTYNCFLDKRGYCFEHLRRDTLEIVEENPKSAECRVFAEALVPLIVAAITLRNACAATPRRPAQGGARPLRAGT